VATSVVTGCEADGAGGRSAAGCVGSTSGTTGAATGSVVGVGVAGVAGGTTLGGGAASELPVVLGTGTSGSKIGRGDSLAGSQIETGV
jgi:hypothetical protein